MAKYYVNSNFAYTFVPTYTGNKLYYFSGSRGNIIHRRKFTGKTVNGRDKYLATASCVTVNPFFRLLRPPARAWHLLIRIYKSCQCCSCIYEQVRNTAGSGKFFIRPVRPQKRGSFSLIGRQQVVSTASHS